MSSDRDRTDSESDWYSPQDAHCAELSHNDQRMLDALVECGFDLDALELSDAERTRAETLLNLFGLLHDYPVDDADETLMYATLARIDRYEDAQAERMNLAVAEEESSSRRWRGLGFRMPDLIAVAAAILLVASVGLPVLHSMRQRSIDLACAQNLRNMAFAFSMYAEDNNNLMPIARAGIGTWDQFSNAVNLQPLLHGQYCDHSHCRCPGSHDNLNMGYSYQWQRSDEPMTWGVTRLTIAMGDRNPLMDAARSGRFIDAYTMSPDHGGRGQNVLATDGATIWLGDRPIVGQVDNIWLPHGARQLVPGATPRNFRDVFLAH